MTDSELYKKTFSRLHAANTIHMNETAKKHHNLRVRPAVLVCLVAVLAIGSAVTAFADEIASGYREARVMIGLAQHRDGDIAVRLGDEEIEAQEMDVYDVEYFGVKELETVYKLSETEYAHILPFDIHESSDEELSEFGLTRKQDLNYLSFVTQNGGVLFSLTIGKTDEDGREYDGYAIDPKDMSVTSDGRIIYWHIDRYTGADGEEICEEQGFDLTDLFNSDGYARYDFEQVTARYYRDGVLTGTDTELRSLRLYRNGDSFYGIICNDAGTPEFEF